MRAPIRRGCEGGGGQRSKQLGQTRLATRVLNTRYNRYMTSWRISIRLLLSSVQYQCTLRENVYPTGELTVVHVHRVHVYLRVLQCAPVKPVLHWHSARPDGFTAHVARLPQFTAAHRSVNINIINTIMYDTRTVETTKQKSTCM